LIAAGLLSKPLLLRPLEESARPTEEAGTSLAAKSFNLNICPLKRRADLLMISGTQTKNSKSYC
jgi:hypothetical protein